MVIESNIDVASILDEQKAFYQTLAFSACIVPDKELAFEMIRMLVVDFGVNPTKADTLKQTPLFYAAREGNAKIVAFLCEVSRGENINRQDRYGQTPIYYSVREGNIEITQQLMDCGADYDF